MMTWAWFWKISMVFKHSWAMRGCFFFGPLCCPCDDTFKLFVGFVVFKFMMCGSFDGNYVCYIWGNVDWGKWVHCFFICMQLWVFESFNSFLLPLPISLSFVLATIGWLSIMSISSFLDIHLYLFCSILSIFIHCVHYVHFVIHYIHFYPLYPLHPILFVVSIFIYLVKFFVHFYPFSQFCSFYPFLSIMSNFVGKSILSLVYYAHFAYYLKVLS